MGKAQSQDYNTEPVTLLYNPYSRLAPSVESLHKPLAATPRVLKTGDPAAGVTNTKAEIPSAGG